MDKEVERRFLETLSRALVSLPFDVKVLLEGVTDSDLEHAVRELAAATVVHIITPKDGNVEAYARHAEDVILLRLALRKIAAEGGEGAPAFRDRFSEMGYSVPKRSPSSYRKVPTSSSSTNIGIFFLA